MKDETIIYMATYIQCLTHRMTLSKRHPFSRDTISTGDAFTSHDIQLNGVYAGQFDSSTPSGTVTEFGDRICAASRLCVASTGYAVQREEGRQRGRRDQTAPRGSGSVENTRGDRKAEREGRNGRKESFTGLGFNIVNRIFKFYYIDKISSSC